MISMELVTIIMTIIGIVIIGVTYVFIKNEKVHQSNLNEVDFERYYNELNNTAMDIYKELDDKYKEILVIYDIIEKKHNDIKTKSASMPDITFDLDNLVRDTTRNKKDKKSINNLVSPYKDSMKKVDTEYNDENIALDILNIDIKKNKAAFVSKEEDVRFLLSQGFKMDRIAKELNIGIGEVQLIKELFKVKNEQK